ncbi:MAG TPA: alcohol dehydrogenase, partial [Planctomycetaceae bacterium]|nr:alcohol dehydrogenase [Planctomycetaceae bacterium]
LLVNSFPQVLNTPEDLKARGNMQLGAHFAGAAIENSMLGATHALANPLSAHFGLTHGIAIGIMLPHVIRFNAELVGRQYSLLASDIGLCEPQDPAGAGLLAEHFQSLVSLAGAPTTLSECEVDLNLVDQLAEEASRQWTGKFNPRPVDQSSLRDLYECAY